MAYQRIPDLTPGTPPYPDDTLFEVSVDVGGVPTTVSARLSDLVPPAPTGINVQQAIIDLSSSDLLSLNSSPKTIVAAPGSSFFVNILSVTWVYFFNSVAYVDSGNDTQLCFGGLGSGKFGDAATGAVLTGSSAAFVTSYPFLASQFIYPSSAINKALILTGSADMTAGDGAARLIVTYTINDVPQ